MLRRGLSDHLLPASLSEQAVANKYAVCRDVAMQRVDNSVFVYTQVVGYKKVSAVTGHVSADTDGQILTPNGRRPVVRSALVLGHNGVWEYLLVGRRVQEVSDLAPEVG